MLSGDGHAKPGGIGSRGPPPLAVGRMRPHTPAGSPGDRRGQRGGGREQRSPASRVRGRPMVDRHPQAVGTDLEKRILDRRHDTVGPSGNRGGESQGGRMKTDGGSLSTSTDYESPAVACAPLLTPDDERLAPLVDSFGRVHRDLRISVTDRCNIRCFYCMPDGVVQFKPRSELLTFEEIERFVEVAASLGIHKLRLTGGEPLVRHDLPVLVAGLAKVPGIVDIALTSNGILLAEQAQALRDAGLHRLNISLDTLSPETFRRISRRDGLERVLEGIVAAIRVGFDKIKLNAIAIKDLTEPDVVPLARFARRHGLELRFIEYMPLDADGNWRNDQVLSGKQIMR